MLTTLALVVAVATAPDALPLEDGFRWIYHHEGQEGLVLEVDGTFEVGDLKATVLRVSGTSLWWTSQALLLTQDDKGLVQHGSLYDDELYGDDEPRRKLLPPKLGEGVAWQCSDFRAKVLAKEQVTVPAGSYHAWKIEYVLEPHLGTESDLHVWIAPGVGIVRLSKFQESSGGAKTPYEHPEVFDLVKAFQPRTHDFGGFPKLTDEQRVLASGLVERLSRKTVENEGRLSDLLAGIGRGVLPVIAKRLTDADLSAPARKRLQAIVDRFPKLGVTLTARGRIKVGESPRISVKVENLAPQPTLVIRSLDASDVGWRYPKYTIEIVNPAGKPETLDMLRCGNMNVLRKNDFMTLHPGEKINPFGPGTFGHYMLGWKPSAPGVYRIRLTLDQSGKVPDAWTGELDLGSLSDEAKTLLERLPLGVYRTDWVTVTVR